MMCLVPAFDGSVQVHFLEKKITLSDRKPGNLNLLMVEPRDTCEAVDAGIVVCRALASVRIAVPWAKRIEVVPDLVGLTDVADIVSVSRQNMRKLMLAHPGSFPAPV